MPPSQGSSVLPRMSWGQWLGVAAGFIVLALATFALMRISREVHLSDVTAAVHATPTRALLLSTLFTVVSYIVLTGYDVPAVRHLGYALRYRLIALASFTSYTMSHTLGVTVLTGGSVRYRMYTRVGDDADRCGTDHPVMRLHLLAGHRHARRDRIDRLARTRGAICPVRPRRRALGRGVAAWRTGSLLGAGGIVAASRSASAMSCTCPAGARHSTNCRLALPISVVRQRRAGHSRAAARYRPAAVHDVPDGVCGGDDRGRAQPFAGRTRGCSRR